MKLKYFPSHLWSKELKDNKFAQVIIDNAFGASSLTINQREELYTHHRDAMAAKLSQLRNESLFSLKDGIEKKIERGEFNVTLYTGNGDMATMSRKLGVDDDSGLFADLVLPLMVKMKHGAGSTYNKEAQQISNGFHETDEALVRVAIHYFLRNERWATPGRGGGVTKKFACDLKGETVRVVDERKTVSRKRFEDDVMSTELNLLNGGNDFSNVYMDPCYLQHVIQVESHHHSLSDEEEEEEEEEEELSTQQLLSQQVQSEEPSQIEEESEENDDEDSTSVSSC